MNIKQVILVGLILPLLFVLTPASAANLSNKTINNIQQNIKPAIPGNAAIKKTLPAGAIPVNRTQACPRLVAKGLRIVRVVSQPGRSGEQAYRFILDGNIANRGATGLANAGLNVTQSVQGKPAKRIALKLFKQQVRKKQVLDVSRDLHLTIQSDALTRAQASHTVFKMNVTNLRNDQGNCGEYNPTVSTLSAADVSRALPAQIRGVSQQAGVITPVRKPPARAGFGVPAVPVKRSLKTQKSVHGLKPPPIKAGIPVPGKVHPVIPGKSVSAQIKPVVKPPFSSMQTGKQNPPSKPVQGFAPVPQVTKKNPVKGRSGFTPKVAAGSFGLNKPVTATGGKSFLPPTATSGTRHVLHDDRAPQPRLGGFAPVLGVNTDIARAPLTGPAGTSLLPDAVHGYAIKVSYKITDRSMTRVLSEVMPNQEVVLRLSFRNNGDEKSPRLIVDHFDHYNGHVAYSIGVPELAPGEVYQSGFIVTVNSQISNDGASWWPYGFRITEQNGGNVTLVNSRDFLDAADLVMPIGGPRLTVVQISDIQLLRHFMTNDRTNGQLGSFREDISARVKIKNFGNASSEATTLTATLRSTRSVSPERSDPQVTFVRKYGRGSVSQPLIYTNRIPSLSPGEEFIMSVHFGDVSYNLMDVKVSSREAGLFGITHHTETYHRPEAAGAFACSVRGWESHDPMRHHYGWVGSEFSIHAVPESNGRGKSVSGAFGTLNYVGEQDFVCQVS